MCYTYYSLDLLNNKNLGLEIDDILLSTSPRLSEHDEEYWVYLPTYFYRYLVSQITTRFVSCYYSGRLDIYLDLFAIGWSISHS